MENKLKLAVFNTQPPHLYFGGVERRILETAKQLSDKVDTNVYSGTKNGFKKTTSVNGIRIVPCKSTDKVFPLDNWVFNRSLSRMVNKIDAEVYEAHAVSGYGFLNALKKHKISKPFIQTVHGVLADEYIQSSKIFSPSLKTKLSNFFMKHLGNIEKEAAQKATLVVTISNYSFKKIVDLYGIDPKKIRIVPNGVDLQRFKPDNEYQEAKKLVGDTPEHVVLFVGNLIPRKGLPFLVDAAKYVIKENKNTKFVVVGDGPLKDNLISYSHQQGVFDNFAFLGRVSDSILPQLYNYADLFVSPSVQEGQGITFLEAQASAKPVVAFNVSAIAEVVKHKQTGYLVEPNNQQLGNAISDLLANDNLREKMGKRGREFVSNMFSWNVTSQKLFQVYSEVTQTP
ncbi:MAG: glycosyltransferase family 4 protein [Candidatus Bathyarchaeota archaeon]|nr:glycosyltransferase family 4 protein [Candidatus Bathyarchaeum tardum]